MLKRTGTIVDFWIDRQVGRMKYAECSSLRFQDQVQVLCWVQQLWPGKQWWSLTAPFSRSWPASSLSYRKFIECRYIGLFRISNSISYRTSHIEYLDILKTNDFFCLFSPKIPKIRRKFQKFAENSENSPKIRRKFLKKKVFFEALISYRIVSYREKNPHIVSISYRIEKKLIATDC